jgi:hypothetical protein
MSCAPSSDECSEDGLTRSRQLEPDNSFNVFSISTAHAVGRLDDHVQDEAGTRLVRTMYDRFCSAATGAMGKPFFDGKSFTGSIDRLSLPLARTLAEDFFGMLYTPMYGSAQARELL